MAFIIHSRFTRIENKELTKGAKIEKNQGSLLFFSIFCGQKLYFRGSKMAQKKYFQEAQNSPAFSLLALLVEGGGSMRVESKNGQAVLWVSPDDLARKLGWKIKAFKRELILLAGHCPECGERLTVRTDAQKWSQRQFCAKEGHFSGSRDLPDFPVFDRNGKEM